MDNFHVFGNTLYNYLAAQRDIPQAQYLQMLQMREYMRNMQVLQSMVGNDQIGNAQMSPAKIQRERSVPENSSPERVEAQTEKKSNIQSDNLKEEFICPSENKKRNKYHFITEKESSQNEDGSERSRYFKCTFKDCEKIFPKESNLNDHVRIHTGEKPYRCNQENCGKSFSQLGNLKKHETVHLGEKPFYCEYPSCGKGFSAMYNLKIHSRSHSGEKPYKCRIEDCEREFYDKGNLKYHEKTSHSYEMKSLPFSCEHVACNLKFKTKKLKLDHHYDLEASCKNEKSAMIKLLAHFKKFTLSLLDKFGVDKTSIENEEDYINLKSNYEDLTKKLLDSELFLSTLGSNLTDLPDKIGEVLQSSQINNSNINTTNINENSEL